MIGGQIITGNWEIEDVPGIYAELEVPNWAPWLAASQESLMGRVQVFPEGQLIVKSIDDLPLASLSMNKISWDGDPNSLPCWDEVAGDPTTYEKTYEPEGNTLVMMSMNVHPEYQGHGYARNLIAGAKLTAMSLGVKHLIGSFRPNEYGKHKLAYGSNSLDFGSYCQAVREDGWPIDSWIRNLTRNGMQSMGVDEKAMTVACSIDEFTELQRTYKPEIWRKNTEGLWECGEVGAWEVVGEDAIYKESNLWGYIWTRSGLQ